MGTELPKPADSWAARRAYWERKLHRLRFAAEPIEEQIAKYKRVTWVLTIISSIIALMFVALFTAFRRPDLGLLFALILFGPIVAFAWLDFKKLKRDAFEYLAERGESKR